MSETTSCVCFHVTSSVKATPIIGTIRCLMMLSVISVRDVEPTFQALDRYDYTCHAVFLESVQITAQDFTS